jgi:inositol phosphorylceramide synthase catalytic subunit
VSHPAAADTHRPVEVRAHQGLRGLAFVRALAGALALILLLAVYLAGRLRAEHAVLLPAFGALPWIGPRAARLWTTVAPFVLVGVVYDLFVLVLPMRGPVHVADLYGWELSLFSVAVDGARMTPPELFARWTSPVLDLVCGFAYATYLFEVFAVGLWLHFKARPLALELALGFLALNVLGMILWFSFPAAPPWYVVAHGLGPAKLDVAPSAAGAARFDALLGITYFQSFYSRNVNVFGAMPSLHVAYPTLVACLVRPFGAKAFVPAALFAVLVAFAAVYLVHHYVLDVLAGAALALVVYAVISRLSPLRSNEEDEERRRVDP